MKPIVLLNRRICIALTTMFLAWLPVQSMGEEHDARYASLNCGVEGEVLSCKYRISADLNLKEVSIKVADSLVQIPEGGLRSFPQEGESVAVLVLVDVSDPARRATVEDRSVNFVKYFLSAQKSYEKIGLATFDSDLTVLAPIGSSSEEVNSALKRIKATGQSTEFYKSVLSGVELLQKTDADRKGLVVISDGKDEDKAYSLSDVVRAAKIANVAVMGVGFAEKLSDSPYLQTLKRLSDETYGEYINASEGKFNSGFISKPFGFVEKGGEIRIDASSYHGAQKVEIILGATDGKAIELSTEVDFSKNRTYLQKATGIVVSYWIWLVGGFVFLLALCVTWIKILRAKKASENGIIDYAILTETDGIGTRHVINKKANRIGRSRDNDIILANDCISSHHAEIHMRREGAFYIVDLSSTNGVYVNDQRINQAELNDGDLIELGEVRLRFTTAA